MKKFLISVCCIWLCLLLCLGLCSCATTVHADCLSGEYSRQTADEGEVTEEGNAALMEFSFELFRKTVTKDQKNELVSPLSAAAVLAMIANGAEGETLHQLETLLGADRDTLNRYYYALLNDLPSTEKCKVSFADSIWFKKNEIGVLPEFLQANADWYDADAYSADFDAGTLKDINNWVKENTDGMIDSILEEIPAGAVMYLINTLLFDAKWAGTYEKYQISDGTFTSYGGRTGKVTYLSSIEGTYLSGDGFCGFAKNYDGGRYSFVALLPDEGSDIYDFIGTLSGETWEAIWKERISTAVSVRLPEFRFDAKLNLKDSLEPLGVTDLFSPGVADLSGIDGTRGLYCSDIAQKTMIDVNRNGTKAAAVTWAEMTNGSAPMSPAYQVHLTRPFVFAIVDNATGVPLFLGAVTNPG